MSVSTSRICRVFRKEEESGIGMANQLIMRKRLLCLLGIQHEEKSDSRMSWITNIKHSEETAEIQNIFDDR